MGAVGSATCFIPSWWKVVICECSVAPKAVDCRRCGISLSGSREQLCCVKTHAKHVTANKDCVIIRTQCAQYTDQGRKIMQKNQSE